MKYTSMSKITMSKTAVKDSFEEKISGYWMHRLLIVGSQKLWMGVQLKMPTRNYELDQWPVCSRESSIT